MKCAKEAQSELNNQREKRVRSRILEIIRRKGARFVVMLLFVPAHTIEMNESEVVRCVLCIT